MHNNPTLFSVGIPIQISGLKNRCWMNAKMSEEDNPTLTLTNSYNGMFTVVGTIVINHASTSKPKEIEEHEFGKTIEFITINREVLLNFYNHSTDDDVSDVRDFYGKLRRVS